MLILSIFLLFLSQSLSKPIADIAKLPTFPGSFENIRLNAQKPDICQSGDRNVVVDSVKRRQILEWNIGSINATQTPVACETTMGMDYDVQWQYAVIEVHWKGYASLMLGTQALAGLSYGFGPTAPLPATLSWLITGPYENDWAQHYSIPSVSQDWSPCGQTTPLNFEWRVQIKTNNKALSSLSASPGALGRSTSSGGNLTLQIVTEWKECSQQTQASQPSFVT